MKVMALLIKVINTQVRMVITSGIRVKFIFLVLVQIIFWLACKKFLHLRSSVGHGLVRKREIRKAFPSGLTP